MNSFKAHDVVKMKSNVSIESSRDFRMDSNIRHFFNSKNDHNTKLRIISVDTDDTVHIEVIGKPGIHQYWLDTKCVELISYEPVATGIGNSVEKLEVVNYKFEGQVYNDKKQLLGVLLDKVEKINSNNFSEVMKKLKEVEETWKKM